MNNPKDLSNRKRIDWAIEEVNAHAHLLGHLENYMIAIADLAGIKPKDLVNKVFDEENRKYKDELAKEVGKQTDKMMKAIEEANKKSDEKSKKDGGDSTGLSEGPTGTPKQV